jgi:hypothetical protein
MCFFQDTYTMYVLESLSVGEPVLTLVAEDLDRNAILEYDIVEPISARDKTGNSLTNRVSKNRKRVNFFLSFCHEKLNVLNDIHICYFGRKSGD